MPRPSVSQRLRAKLRPLLCERGTAAALVKFSHDRPHGRGILAQELSYFLNNTTGRGRKGITMDDLDDIADFFRLSLGELFDVRATDLSGDEQRLVRAFHTLPPVTQEHVLALVETASATERFVRFHRPSDRLR